MSRLVGILLALISAMGVTVSAYGLGHMESPVAHPAFVDPAYVTTEATPDISKIQAVPYIRTVPHSDSYALAAQGMNQNMTQNITAQNITGFAAEDATRDAPGTAAGTIKTSTQLVTNNSIMGSDSADSVYFQVAEMPEPTEGMVLLCGLVIAGFIARRRLGGS